MNWSIPIASSPIRITTVGTVAHEVVVARGTGITVGTADSGVV
ncbi:hypothetical protein ACFQE1_03890 [Halobium palmae]|uniref:Uncharacterized protein n=1 Tax=Halobium palmae TaxID=1776492 RepID=A0ABD5RWE0_9EURY